MSRLARVDQDQGVRDGLRHLVATDNPDHLDVQRALTWIVEQRGGGRTTLLVVPTFDQLRHPVLVDLIGRDALELARRERWLPIALAGRAPVEVAVATERTLRLQPLRLADAALALVWPTDRFVERVLDLLPDAHVLVVPATQEAEARFVERFGFEVIVGG